MHCDVISMIFEYYSKQNFSRSKIMNFCKRSYQPILRYFYTATIKHGDEISLHKHFDNGTLHVCCSYTYTQLYFCCFKDFVIGFLLYIASIDDDDLKLFNSP